MTRRSSSEILAWSLAALVVAACGPRTRPGEDGGEGTGDNDTAAGTESLSAEDTGTPFECPGARWYEGSLTVDDSTDVDSLRDIGGVTGWLAIADTTSLVDLEFLSCLEEVGAQQVSLSMSITNNTALQSLHGLERLRTVGSYGEGLAADGTIYITDNPVLASVAELAALEEIGRFAVWGDPSLGEVELPAIRRIGMLDLGGSLGALGLTCLEPERPSTMSLTSVGHYPLLESVDDLSIYNQPDLASLAPVTEAAQEGVVFGSAEFVENHSLPDSEIEAFAAAAAIEPVVCKYEPTDPDVCWQSGPQCGGG
jgi:hypothetical protein